MRMFRRIAWSGTAAAAAVALFAGNALATSSGADGLVVSHAGLKVHAHANLGAKVVGVLDPWQKVKLACQTESAWVQGNDIWYRLQGRPGWVSARYVHNYTLVPWC
ncbi:SH3 domain-containing protein [Streptomyces sp. NPDC059564]|uniref:SH3 domain-containing protein n=1 Tax=Streptomyces sp. NPDC059564 TaxID=3346865 RepID=UPI00368F88F7